MSDPFLGQVCSFGFNFAPFGWAMCNGQTLPISQYDALFSLLGTTYGGDGVTTFALPNLQGRVPINQGSGPGLNTYQMGQVGGTENVTLQTSQIPQHTHFLNTSGAAGSANVPSSSTYLSDTGPGTPAVLTYVPFANAQPLTGPTVSLSGGNLPHVNQQPLLVISYCICLQGIYPSQN